MKGTHAEISYPRMIAFFGPDGAGKSTQANLLTGFLESQGVNIKRVWVRSTHTFAFLLWMVFDRLNLCEDRSGFLKKMKTGFAVSYLNESSYGAFSPITMSPPRLRGKFSKFVWSTIEILGLVPVVFVQVYIPLLLKRVAVAERFLVDSIASIAYFVGNDNFDESWQAKFLLKLIPKDTALIYVDADYDTILMRRGLIAGPPEYTEFHRRIYSKLRWKVGALYVDASKDSIEEASKKILNFVIKRDA